MTGKHPRQHISLNLHTKRHHLLRRLIINHKARRRPRAVPHLRLKRRPFIKIRRKLISLKHIRAKPIKRRNIRAKLRLRPIKAKPTQIKPIKVKLLTANMPKTNIIKINKASKRSHRNGAGKSVLALAIWQQA